MERLLTASLLLALLAAVVAGCTNKPTSVESGPQSVKPIGVDRAAPEDKNSAAASVNQFAVELLGRLDKKSNIVFSPLSISSALAMTYAGARGQTAEEMAKALHFRLDNQRLHPALAVLMWQVQGSGEQRGHRLNIANGLWLDKNASILEDFLQSMKDNYAAGIEQTEFRKPEDARQRINTWVAQKTADRIKELVRAGDLSEATRLVLVNALYFKGDWQHAFKGDDTYDAPFHVTPSEKVPVPMMHQTARFSSNADKTFQLLELPYKDSNLSLVVLLPRRLDGLDAFEKELTAEALTTWLSQAQGIRMMVALPKFQLTHRLDLAELLRAMGMRSAFDPPKADFSGMTNERPLFLSKVVHEAWLEVDEKGTEAAAATAAVGMKSARPGEFRADHPFLFLLRDKDSGSILFLGRMSNPKS